LLEIFTHTHTHTDTKLTETKRGERERERERERDVQHIGGIEFEDGRGIAAAKEVVVHAAPEPMDLWARELVDLSPANLGYRVVLVQ